MIACHRFQTALGCCELHYSELGIRRLKLRVRSRTSISRTGQPDWVRRAAALITRHLAGERVDLDRIQLDLGDLSPFQRRVYTALREVSRGSTISYGELAARAGSPRGARAVGSAMACNPVPLLIPCHRVLRADGSPGGFSAPGGVRTKEKLLEIEGGVLH